MMDCRQAQSVLALAVGQDLSETATLEAVRVHVAGCPVCRRLERDLAVAHTALSESRTVPRTRRGLWPQVAACIAEWERRPQFARFNVWVPSLAAAAACLLLVSVAVLEVEPRTQNWLPGQLVRQSEPSRNLFETDPVFASTHGEMISAEDVARWRRKHLNGSTEAVPAEWRLRPDVREVRR